MEYNRAYYLKGSTWVRKRHVNKSSHAQRGNKAFVNNLKSNPCTDCEVTYPPWVMQFDHVKGTKIKGIAHMLGSPRQKLEEELAKCELVCANCHCERTHSRKIVSKRIS